MARMREEDRSQAVNDALTAGGGTMTHEALVGALQTAGKAEAAESLRRLKREGKIYSRLEGQANGTPVLRYSLTPFPPEQGQVG